MKKIFITFLLFILCWTANAQSIHVPKGNQAYHIIDRLEIKSGEFAPFHTAHKYYQRKDVVQYALSLDTMSWLTRTDKTDLRYLYLDNSHYLGETPHASLEHPKYERPSKPFLKYFYKSRGKFYEHTSKELSIVAQPISATDLFGVENTESGNSGYFMMNNGMSIQGNINNKVHFYSRVISDFDRYQPHVRRFMAENQAIPGRAFYTNNTNEFGNVDSLYDNINATGYIDFKATKNIHFQFGHGRNSIGNGMRSLILSDFGANYLYLKVNTKFGLFDYENIFAEMRQLSTLQTSTGVLAKKFLTAHHLSFNVTKNFNVGIYEGIISARENGIELQYLNPVIFYRSIERDLDSPDNIFIGLDAKWNFAKRFQLYGQLGLDELQLGNLIPNPNSWAHKFAIQAGLKYIDVLGIDHLDMQLELNRVRPYTYTHFDTETSYSHFSQPLAHPLGANFNEFLAVLRYQPTDKLSFNLKVMKANIGRDTLSSNWGSNIFLSYRTRDADVVSVGQGVNTDIFMLDFQAEYMIFHNYYATFHAQYRNEDSVLNGLDYNHLFMSLGLRLNFWNEPHFF